MCGCSALLCALVKGAAYEAREQDPARPLFCFCRNQICRSGIQLPVIAGPFGLPLPKHYNNNSCILLEVANPSVPTTL